MLPALWITVITSVHAATLHVPEDYASIQDGIDAPQAGDTVLVACGVYYERDLRLRNDVHLLSASGEPDCATIDARGQDRVIAAVNLSEYTPVEGFTLLNGDAHTDLNEDLGTVGDGLGSVDSYVVLLNCVIRNSRGSAIYLNGTGHPVFRDCRITGSGAYSSIIVWGESQPLFEDCVISGNAGQALYYYSEQTGSLRSCLITGNGGYSAVAPYDGGVNLTDCSIVGNDGNGIQFYETQRTLNHCLIAFNGGIGGLSIWGGSA